MCQACFTSNFRECFPLAPGFRLVMSRVSCLWEHGLACITARERSTPHPGPLLVRGGEGELFCGTITQGSRVAGLVSVAPSAHSGWRQFVEFASRLRGFTAWHLCVEEIRVHRCPSVVAFFPSNPNSGFRVADPFPCCGDVARPSVAVWRPPGSFQQPA